MRSRNAIAVCQTKLRFLRYTRLDTRADPYATTVTTRQTRRLAKSGAPQLGIARSLEAQPRSDTANLRPVLLSRHSDISG